MPADTIPEFKDAANARLRSAIQLYELFKENDDGLPHLSTACYLAGYSVEFLLKAAIIKVKRRKKKGVAKFSDLTEKDVLEHECPDCGAKPVVCQCGKALRVTTQRPLYKTHDLSVLMNALKEHDRFTKTAKQWYGANKSKPLFTQWNEQRRYDAVWITSAEQAGKFIDTVRGFVMVIREELK